MAARDETRSYLYPRFRFVIRCNRFNSNQPDLAYPPFLSFLPFHFQTFDDQQQHGRLPRPSPRPGRPFKPTRCVPPLCYWKDWLLTGPQ